jgi:hypothetical protein
MNALQGGKVQFDFQLDRRKGENSRRIGRASCVLTVVEQVPQ